mmetsp:Transcript_31860/g.73936  ORF Transcript_31860/g.73936 Transcript_31860/m.73936 type:complete len:285 (+) Transcript_31860:364-1218(+)
MLPQRRLPPASVGSTHAIQLQMSTIPVSVESIWMLNDGTQETTQKLHDGTQETMQKLHDGTQVSTLKPNDGTQARTRNDDMQVRTGMLNDGTQVNTRILIDVPPESMRKLRVGTWETRQKLNGGIPRRLNPSHSHSCHRLSGDLLQSARRMLERSRRGWFQETLARHDRYQKGHLEDLGFDHRCGPTPTWTARGLRSIHTMSVSVVPHSLAAWVSVWTPRNGAAPWRGTKSDKGLVLPTTSTSWNSSARGETKLKVLNGTNWTRSCWLWCRSEGLVRHLWPHLA